MKEKLKQLPCEQFLQAFEIHRALLRAKQVGEKRAKIQNPVKIANNFSFPLVIRISSKVGRWPKHGS